MAKRFTASDKWKDTWFYGLSNEQKLFWLYLLDECDHAGVWEKNFDLASFMLRFQITEASALQFLSDKVVPVNGTKWFIPKFIDFQYGELNSANRAHRSVIEKLERLGVDPKKPLTSPFQGAKDKEQDKEMDKEKGKEQEPVKSHPTTISSAELADGRHDTRIADVRDKWNAFAKKHGLASVTMLTSMRTSWIIQRLREPYFDIDKILSGIEKKGWGLGKDNGWRITLDKIISDSEYYIGLIEANTIQTEQQVKADVLYENCQFCGQRLKRTQIQSHYYTCAKNPNLRPIQQEIKQH